MGGTTRRRQWVVVLLAALAIGSATTLQAAADLLPTSSKSQGQPAPNDPTTTVAEDTTTTTDGSLPTILPNDQQPPPADPAPAPAPAEPAPGGGDSIPPQVDQGEGGDIGGMAVPPDAQRIINSFARTAPNNNQALLDGAAALEASGMAHDEAVWRAFGRFPILGYAHWADDWYYPRWTGTAFRFHLGLDMLAEFGAPVVAPVDGVARIRQSALGGLTVSVTQPDGTFYYLAHLSGLAPGLVEGMAVTTGQVVGYVGTSGNAVGGAPHLHFAIHPGGRDPIPPKPVVDAWVADGITRSQELLGQAAVAAIVPAAVTATGLTRSLADGVAAGRGDDPAGPPRAELLWATAANPAGGGVQLAEASAAALGSSIDWERRAVEQRALDLAWRQSANTARRVLAPLTNPFLRAAAENRRITAAPS